MLTTLGLLLLELVLGNTNQPVQAQRSCNVEDDVHPHESKVAPAVREVDMDSRQERVSLGHGAVLARACVVVREVPACCIQECCQVLAAGAAARGLELNKLLGGTGHRRIRKRRAQEAFHNVCERVDPVHENPEAGEIARTRKNTRENVSQVHEGLTVIRKALTRRKQTS